MRPKVVHSSSLPVSFSLFVVDGTKRILGGVFVHVQVLILREAQAHRMLRVVLHLLLRSSVDDQSAFVRVPPVVQELSNAERPPQEAKEKRSQQQKQQQHDPGPHTARHDHVADCESTAYGGIRRAAIRILHLFAYSEDIRCNSLVHSDFRSGVKNNRLYLPRRLAVDFHLSCRLNKNNIKHLMYDVIKNIQNRGFL